ncbi:MFS transporter [Corynebacterium cystitidis]|uniref:MFS transporter n=2 Tax=Corynebacterium cystitidis TaxID=35757 RepID=UPI00211E9683|nr:MFS transporter [Corynebacterium cystitidis]
MSSRHQGNRSSLAGFFGSTLEYYDMYIYASASALVFSQIFFPEATGGMGLLLAFGTYGVAYLARPLGGFLAGHFGDTFGRKNVMVVMLLVMGFATVGIGLLPTYEAIGIWAPILLVSLRLLQGMSVGGELAGATSLTMEHAPEGKRAFLVSWLIQGIWAGYIIATLAFIAVATLPDEQLFAWGWRIPFWASILIVILGLWIRLALEEPEEFRKQKDAGKAASAPIREVFTTQPLDVLRVVFASFLLVISTTVPVYGLSYSVNTMGMDKSDIMWATVVAYALALITQPLFAKLSDRIGRKPVMIAGNLTGGIAVWGFFWAVGQTNLLMVWVMMILCISVCFAMVHAIYPTLFAEMFNVRYRMSGMAIGLQIGIIATGFSPMIIQALSQANDNHWWPAAAVTTVACLISAAAVASCRETAFIPLNKLGTYVLLDETKEPAQI